MSEGQRRGLALARVLAGEHDLLLLDEPTDHLSLDRALRRRFRGVQKGIQDCA